MLASPNLTRYEYSIGSRSFRRVVRSLGTCLGTVGKFCAEFRFRVGTGFGLPTSSSIIRFAERSNREKQILEYKLHEVATPSIQGIYKVGIKC